MKPEVSVVIPTRNRRDLVARAVRSVLAQTVPVQVVVVDEASTDGTAERMASFGDAVKVVRHERPLGAAVARNDGVATAIAEWVAFCDDDDVWAPGKLAAQLAALAASPEARWSVAGAVWVDTTGRVLRGDLPPAGGDVAADLLRENNIPGGGSGVVARTDEIRAVGGFDPRLQTLADWELWIRLALRSPLASVRRPLVAYHVHASNMSYDVALRRREMRVVEEAHRTARAARGVELDRARQRRYDALTSQRAGRRVRPALWYLGEARRQCSVGLLATSARSLVAPRAVVQAHDAAKVSQLPAGWAEEVAGWLPAAWRYAASHEASCWRKAAPSQPGTMNRGAR